ncbi:MAG: MBL fold metallo-hydrolase [Candidatus Lokiarchaeota archaeon]|nr:MBL fold metallo-hydrolase [Candidatus Lokiarchaeota archaeon]
MVNVLDLAEKLWTGQTNTYLCHPFAEPYDIEQIIDGLWFYKGFSNSIIRETSDGLILIDPAAQFDEAIRFTKVRSISKQKANSIIFTHGHVDHAFGVKPYYRECKRKNWKKPHIISHVNVPKRFGRYIETHGYNAFINQRQFLGGQGQPYFPIEFIYPTILVENSYELNVGGVTVNLFHGRGETDDALWIYLPNDKVLCTGDFFVWGVPNAGNPQKAQRYIKEWAENLLKMAEKDAEILLPGHGVPIIGKERVKKALSDTAEYLDLLYSQTIDLMNQRLSLSEIIEKVTFPEDLKKKPYLQPIYDEPEFLIRSVWTKYGGWYDGIPSHLKPAAEQDIANEIVDLVGGSENLVNRAMVLCKQKKVKVACHLIEWALRSDPNNDFIKKAYAQIYAERARSESSTMAMAIYLSAIREIGEDPGRDLKGNTVIYVQTQLAKEKKQHQMK